MTSPQKAGHPDTQGAKATQNSFYSTNVIQEFSYTDFLANHLPAASQQPEAEQSWNEEQKGLVASIRDVKSGNEFKLYTGSAPLIKLCNAVSTSVSKSLSPKVHKAVVFHSHHNKTLSDPLGSPLKPDIVVSYEETMEPGDTQETNEPEGTQDSQGPESTKRFTWFNIAAVGEAKVRDPKQERGQAALYLRKHLQLRPELHSVIGFSADTKGYSLYYHDASAIHVCSVEWENPVPLYAFVRQLYQGTPTDPSIINLRPDEPNPSWFVKIEELLLLITNATPKPGLSQRRVTGIGLDLTTDCDRPMPIFMKDYYPDILRRFDEGLLYKKAHDGKMVPGMMRADYHGHPLDASGNKLTTTGLGIEENENSAVRWKKRVVTRDVGASLRNCSSLLEFLKIMYDACVVQRNLHRKSVLHRDISENNIMMASKDDGRYYKECSSGFDEVKYLNQVLDPDETPKPACLVIDLGHGADLDELKRPPATESEILAEITGTPKFTSRSVSLGRPLEDLYKPVKLPELTEEARKRYAACYTEYDAYDKAVSEGGQPSSDPQFMHRLFHDAESTFWVIAWFLTCSAPKDVVEKSQKSKESIKETKAANKKRDSELAGFVRAMESHVPGQKDDSRQSLSTRLEIWKQILHPGLDHVAPMLSEMHRYILPEWGYRDDLTENYPEHAHEALMRLLFRHIIEIINDKTKDVEFAPAGTRVLPVSKPLPKSKSVTITTTLTVPSASSMSTNKRGRSVEDDGAELKEPRPSKRRHVQSAGDGEKLAKLIAEAKAHKWADMLRNYKLDSGSHFLRSPPNPSAP